MREEIRYIADDGTVFYDEEDCKDYEFELAGKGLNIQCLDFNEKVSDIKELDTAYYINLPTEEAVKYAETVGNYYGYSVPHSTGRFFYDTDKEEWVNIDDKIEYYKDEIKRLDKFFK